MLYLLSSFFPSLPYSLPSDKGNVNALISKTYSCAPSTTNSQLESEVEIYYLSDEIAKIYCCRGI